ncbi:MAG: hypothetical protein WBZ50_02715 [Nitrososphaeraceae archaeon]|jgi:hypothetical protein
MFNKYVWYAASLSIFLILITATGTSSKLANNVYAQNADNTTQPEIGQTIVWQGTVSSFKDPLKGHESHQVAVILPPREDQAVYTGVISFIASKPVEVVTLHDYTLGNMTIPDKFGVVMKAPTPWREGGEVATAMMALDYPKNTPTFSANVPFVGNALGLHTTNGDQFVATYTVVAQVLKANTMNNVDSAVNATK